MTATWLLIDGDNWFAQCDYASAGSAAGTMLGRLEVLATQVADSTAYVCWDRGRSYRYKLRPGYKAGRAAKPAGYAERRDYAREYLLTNGVPTLFADGFEADDVIATLARQVTQAGARAVIFSADSDLFQLLQAGRVSQVTRVRRAERDRLEFETTTAATLEETRGVRPDQWLEFKALVGDQSDNIRGTPNIGPTTASAVLKKCGTLERFFADPFRAPINDRRRNAILADREAIAERCEIIRLANVPGLFDSSAATV